MNKGTVSIVIIMMITMMITSVSVTAKPIDSIQQVRESSFIYGDIDEDGLVTSTDYQLIKRHIMGIEDIIDNNKLKTADVDGDGKINSKDLVLVRRYILDIISKFPVEEDLKHNVEVLGKWTLYSTSNAEVTGEFDEEANLIKLKIINSGVLEDDIKLVYNEIFEFKSRYTSLWLMGFLYPSYSFDNERINTNYKLVLENNENSGEVLAQLMINNAPTIPGGPIPNPSWPIDMGKDNGEVRLVLKFGNLNETEYEIHVDNKDLNLF